MTQAEARQFAISRGFDPSEVDAFIQREGGARTSAERIASAFQPTAGSGMTAPTTASVSMGGSGSAAVSPVPSMAALNKAVEPQAAASAVSGDTTNAALTALSGLTGGGGGGGQETADQPSGGLLRLLGRRNPPSGALVLSRKAY